MTVVHAHWILRPGGGPAGYLYNLSEKLGPHGDAAELRVVGGVTSDSRHADVGETSALKWLRESRWIPRPLLAAGLALKALLEGALPLSKRWRQRLAGADVIVFHDFRLYQRYLATARWKLLSPVKSYLMLHSPVEPSQEMRHYWADALRLGRSVGPAAWLWRLAERNAIRVVSGILVPTRYALDGYFVDQPRTRALLISKPLLEVPSGVPPLKPVRSRDTVREEIGCNEGQLAIGYVGRFVSDKGYDLFSAIASECEARPEGSHLKFFGVGQGPLSVKDTQDQRTNFVELGWRSDAADIINAMDVIVVPNRVAYFDLVILEAMSLGKTIYTTAVGGSRSLVDGSVRYLSGQDVRSLTTSLLTSLNKDGVGSADAIQTAYLENYSSDRFLQQHLQLATRLNKIARSETKPEFRPDWRLRAKDTSYETVCAGLAAIGIGNKPNALVVGTIRSGTTSLARFMQAHPDITCGIRKEPAFFSRRYDLPMTRYYANFPVARPAIIDATPDYLFRFPALLRAKAALGDQRVMVMLRDPLARAVSHYSHAIRHGWNDARSLDEAFGLEDVDQNIRLLKSGNFPLEDPRLLYLEQSCYDFQLEMLARTFESVHVMRIEDWITDPGLETLRLAEFLGVDPTGFIKPFPHENRGNSQPGGRHTDRFGAVEEFLRTRNTRFYAPGPIVL